jgi:hypothetical protein
MKKSRHLAIGVRHLSLASGLSHQTVADALRELRSHDDGFVVRLEGDRGADADLYELRIPDRFARPAGTRARWQRIYRVDPLFRDLGLPAFFVHQALGSAPATEREISDRAGLAKTTVNDTLHKLAGVGLARKTRAGWRTGTRTLRAVGRQRGIPDLVAALLEKFRVERQLWRAFLGFVRGPRPAPPPPALPSARPPWADWDDWPSRLGRLALPAGTGASG